ncbi:hypothetical protein BHE74_00001552 [Ensete ventricosum]|nr:hypothetical protein GW17_00018173 [Ensete ventricosum]RWW89507.1 hypothetical protein BHE74_00001552 [Ensete ventricosum]RZR92663.1 hypothetical protein BHM03_00021010 [Ensete ventricosum]
MPCLLVFVRLKCTRALKQHWVHLSVQILYHHLQILQFLLLVDQVALARMQLSRPQRPGEIDGKDYYFVTKEEFLKMVERSELLEYALVYGDYKGIPKQQIRDYMAKGFDIVLRVDIQGAATLRSILGDSAVFIFLVAESESALVKRLVARNTETPEMLLVRIATAKEEFKHMRKFDYVVVNEEGKLDNTVKLVESIIDAEKARVWQRKVQI